MQYETLMETLRKIERNQYFDNPLGEPQQRENSVLVGLELLEEILSNKSTVTQRVESAKEIAAQGIIDSLGRFRDTLPIAKSYAELFRKIVDKYS